MHKTAHQNATKFYEKYCSTNIENKQILDVGSWDGGNGNLRTIFGKGKYTGLDVQFGPNVDVVYDEAFPFNDNYFDIIVSSSCFEHVEFFWELFLEMSRVLKPQGYIYICAPSSGPYHPLHCVSDSWRFYPDSWRSLSKWANINNYPILLKESYIDKSYCPPDENWIDSIGIFTKE
jgi:SAM-dependent methyltransferase